MAPRLGSSHRHSREPPSEGALNPPRRDRMDHHRHAVEWRREPAYSNRTPKVLPPTRSGLERFFSFLISTMSCVG